MKTIVSLAILALTLFLLTPSNAQADCVYLYSGQYSYQIVNQRNVLLYSGSKAVAFIKTFDFMLSPASFRLLKTDFCSYDSAVFLVDDEVIDAAEVKKLD